MLKYWLAIVFCSLSSCALSYERLSFYKLIVAPESYEAKHLYLAGYFSPDGDDCLVVSNDKETALMYREYEMVKLCKGDLSEDVDSKAFERLKNNYGAIAGVFSIRHCGDALRVGSSLKYLGCFTTVNELHGPIYNSGPSMPPPPVN